LPCSEKSTNYPASGARNQISHPYKITGKIIMMYIYIFR
jgi:hypothetical protein